MDEPEEFKGIFPVLNSFPLCEIIIHPRVMKEQYSGPVHAELFEWAAERADVPLCYNGDLFSAEAIRRFEESHTGTERVMVGRGFIMDPAIAREYLGGDRLTMRELAGFMGALEKNYSAVLDGERPLLFKLKELWAHIGGVVAGKDGGSPERLVRNVMTASNMGDYRNAAREIYSRCVIKGA